MYEELHQGKGLSDITRYGKPWHRTFDYAYRRLQETLGDQSLKRVYMVGDNAETDIMKRCGGSGSRCDCWSVQGSGSPHILTQSLIYGLLNIVDAFENEINGLNLI